MTDLVITRIGSGGDGVADGPAGPAYVPFALPGETYVRKDGGFLRTGAASDMRAEPTCRHFGVCGGCVAQHMRADTYEVWKRGIVNGAFRAQGLQAPDFSFVHVAPGTRRRATLAAELRRGGIVLGYHKLGSHDLVALEECPVLLPRIEARFEGLSALAAVALSMMPKKKQDDGVRLHVAALGEALDVRVDAGGTAPDAEGRAKLASLAAEHGFQRIAFDDDVVVLRDVPLLMTRGGPIQPPPGAFFQAVDAAEQTMADTIIGGLGKAKRVADLFAGIGTFSLPIALKARVMAIDSDKAALAALKDAANRAQGLKPITTLHRDLFTDPLSPMELKDFDAVVLDPPRAGAKAQAEALARSKIGTVVMVSCNPQTLARDVAALLAGGFKTGPMVVIDQFLWSGHLESVAVFKR